MKVLILGAYGMLGHKLLQSFAPHFEIAGTARQLRSNVPFMSDIKIYEGVDALNISSVEKVITKFGPNIVINCIGVIKQLEEVNIRSNSINVNALFPHKLVEICNKQDIRMVHFSTDCVFSGLKGNYRETDNPDPIDLYGRSKLLGEVDGPNCLTLRTSIVGREIERHKSLFDWFILQRNGKVKGFTRAIYSGFTTQAIANLTQSILKDHKELEGIWHASSAPISKFDLLTLLNAKLDLNIEVEKEESFFCDRSLDSSRLHTKINFTSPSWDEMIEEFASDSTPYILS